jgi:hypothetical protein
MRVAPFTAGIPAGQTAHHVHSIGPSQGVYDGRTFIPPPLAATSHPGLDFDTAQPGVSGALRKAKRAFPPDQLAELKQVIEGSDLTKTGLIEILKKR